MLGDELEELEDVLGMLGDELEELDELLGMLGDELEELDEDGLGMLGEDGELDELEELGMLGILGMLLLEELDVLWQPASTASDRLTARMAHGDPGNFRDGNQLSMLDVEGCLITIASLPPSGRLEKPEMAGQVRDSDQLSSALGAIRSTVLGKYSLPVQALILALPG